MADDLHTRLREAVAAQLERARRMERMAQEYQLEVQEPRLWGKQVPGWGEWPEVERMARLLAQHCERDLKVLERHAPRRDELADLLELPAGERVICVVSGETWPCDDIRDLATAYGLTPGGARGEVD